jgi:hypothetical protein
MDASKFVFEVFSLGIQNIMQNNCFFFFFDSNSKEGHIAVKLSHLNKTLTTNNPVGKAIGTNGQTQKLILIFFYIYSI